MTRSMLPMALLAATTALSACSTISHAGSRLLPFQGRNAAAHNEPAEPTEGRISILTFEQQLAPDPSLASHTIVVPPPAAAQGWSQPGGVPDNAPVHIGGTAALDVAWRANLGAGSSRDLRIAAPPVIGEGKLFFLDADQVVHAIDAGNGRNAWTHRLRPAESRDRRALGGGLAFDGGRVFVTTGFGFIVALNAETGEEVWRAAVTAPFHSAPTVANGRVYAVTNDSELVAFNAADGQVAWNYQAIAEPARILAASSPAIEGDTVIAPFASGEVISFLNANGRRLWVDSLSRNGRLTSLSAINDIAGRPVVADGIVYAASHSGVLGAIDLRTGQRVWSRAFASTQTPWVAGGVLYAVNVDGELAAFDRTTGNVYWVRQLRRYENESKREGRIVWTGPILVGGKLVLASSAGEVAAVAPETGEISNTGRVGGAVFIPPIASGGFIYIVKDDADLVVLR